MNFNEIEGNFERNSQRVDRRAERGLFKTLKTLTSIQFEKL